MNRAAITRFLFSFLCLGILSAATLAQDSDSTVISGQLFVGHWVINEELSQNTDDQVEVAIRASGGQVQRRSLFRREPEDRYRGGPPEQELYDRVSYDDVLTISYSEPEIRFEYADGFTRIFHDDGRRLTVGVNNYFESGGSDFSMAIWENESLLVEGRPRDGGFTFETYTLLENGARLRVEMELQPQTFGAAVNLIRVYDRESME